MKTLNTSDQAEELGDQTQTLHCRQAPRCTTLQATQKDHHIHIVQQEQCHSAGSPILSLF